MSGHTALVGRSLQDVGLAVKRLQAHHHRTLDTRLAKLGLSLVQWDALRHLDHHPDASLHDLALLTFQSDQAFGTLAGRMIDRGLIARRPGPGRAIRHDITAKGRALLDDGRDVVDSVLHGTVGTLTPAERDTLVDLLAKALPEDSQG
ncbi:MAG: hypothetical protein JWO46_2705 [Nocardioidaceae bacterium]|nr:hypothetical protein [Nocardioidaceae bacterium]